LTDAEHGWCHQAHIEPRRVEAGREQEPPRRE